MRGSADQEFTDWVSVNSLQLVRFAFLVCYDRELAQDLTQEALTRTHRHWSRVAASGDPGGYVRRAIVNQAISWRRRRQAPTPRSSTEPAVPDAAELVGAQEEMWQLLGSLTARQRATLVLRFYEDLDDREIAAVLGCSQATVRSHISKGLAALRHQLKDATGVNQQ